MAPTASKGPYSGKGRPPLRFNCGPLWHYYGRRRRGFYTSHANYQCLPLPSLPGVCMQVYCHPCYFKVPPTIIAAILGAGTDAGVRPWGEGSFQHAVNDECSSMPSSSGLKQQFSPTIIVGMGRKLFYYSQIMFGSPNVPYIVKAPRAPSADKL